MIDPQPAYQEPPGNIGELHPGLSPKKSNRRTIIGICSIVFVMVLCLAVCVLTLGAGVVKSITEKPEITSVIDAFMVAMTNRDVDTAFALFTPRDSNAFLRTDLQNLLQGSNYVLFEGYQGITINTLQVGVTANTNPDLPQGTYAEVEGTIAYDGGFSGTLTATLEQRGSDWTLHHINITVPPAKLDP